MRVKNIVLCIAMGILAAIVAAESVSAQSRQAPPGMFKDVDDESLGDAQIIRGKQLFVDDGIVQEIRGLERQLNQPVKFAGNPVLRRDKPWEESGPGYGTVHYDAESKQFRMWYAFWRKTKGTSTALLAYATSNDGKQWTKPVMDAATGTNLLRHPPIQGFQCPGIFKDVRETDPNKRYKMLFSCNPDGTEKTWMTRVAFSADGFQWTPAGETASIPFSDTQICPFWDEQRRCYVAILRFGPPNTRIISRTESDDFLNWSPKITVLRRTKIDEPMETQFYQMAPFPYAGHYFGLVAAYHRETLKPLTESAPWTDRKNLQLVYSRNGVTWSRVAKHGAIPTRALSIERDWAPIAREAAFLPYGEKDRDWDWGAVSPYFTPQPIIVGDEIWFYYMAQNGRNWWNYSGDPPKLDPNAKEPELAVGLATLRLDGFVSVNAGAVLGTLLTKPFVFLGDTLEINANALGGSLVAEALDADGKPIDGFSAVDFMPISTDSVRHVATWKGQPDSHLLQGRPIRLRFQLKNAKLYSFEPRILRNHYLQSYD